MESEFYRISRKTGRKISFCKCQDCKKQCMTSPCLGTPADIEKIIDAGHKDKIMLTGWAAGVMMGVTHKVIDMYQAIQDNATGACIFFKDGLCSLHEAGLKPTEGKLSNHKLQMDNFNPKKSLSWFVTKEWLDPKNQPIIDRIIKKLNDD